MKLKLKFLHVIASLESGLRSRTRLVAALLDGAGQERLRASTWEVAAVVPGNSRARGNGKFLLLDPTLTVTGAGRVLGPPSPSSGASPPTHPPTHPHPREERSSPGRRGSCTEPRTRGNEERLEERLQTEIRTHRSFYPGRSFQQLPPGDGEGKSLSRRGRSDHPHGSQMPPSALAGRAGGGGGCLLGHLTRFLFLSFLFHD